MTVNPMQLVQMIKNGQNPQQLMLSVLQNQLQGTPLGDNLLNMAQNGNRTGIEQIARNLCASRGMDFDSEFQAFKKQFNL